MALAEARWACTARRAREEEEERERLLVEQLLCLVCVLSSALWRWSKRWLLKAREEKRKKNVNVLCRLSDLSVVVRLGAVAAGTPQLLVERGRFGL